MLISQGKAFNFTLRMEAIESLWNKSNPANAVLKKSSH